MAITTLKLLDEGLEAREFMTGLESKEELLGLESKEEVLEAPGKDGATSSNQWLYLFVCQKIKYLNLFCPNSLSAFPSTLLSAV
ncbi:unnamed protein product [Arctogadus glacialis]